MRDVVVVKGTTVVSCAPEWSGRIGVIAGADFDAVLETLGTDGLLVRLWNEDLVRYENVAHTVWPGCITFELLN